MKKVNFKKVVMAFMVAFTFFFAGVERAAAQAGPGSGLYDPPQGSFVDGSQAQTVLVNALVALKNQLSLLIPGTALYKAAERQYKYYSTIHETLQNGQTVPNGIVEGLGIFLSDVNPATKEQILQLKQEAVELLSN